MQRVTRGRVCRRLLSAAVGRRFRVILLVSAGRRLVVGGTDRLGSVDWEGGLPRASIAGWPTPQPSLERAQPLRGSAQSRPCCALPSRRMCARRQRNDQSRASVAAIGDHCRVADGGLRAGKLAVVTVAGQGLTDHDHEVGVVVNDHLVVGGVPVALGLLGHRVVTGGHQRASHDEDGVLTERPARCARGGPRWSMTRSAADFEISKSGPSWRSVKFVRQ